MNGPDARAEALAAHYERAGYARVSPAILQPAEPFLDLSGEDIRRRMFLTTDPDGQAELRCLDWDQLRELAGAGWEIGSHSCTHALLSALGDAELTWELEHSRRRRMAFPS